MMSTHGAPPRHREWKIGCKVYIGNLTEGASKADIEGAFGKYGPLRNVWVARNPPGFAFVEFEDGRDAENACRHLDGTRIAGGRIKAEMSHGRSRRGPRGPPGFGGRGPPPYAMGAHHPFAGGPPARSPYGGSRGHFNGGDYPYDVGHYGYGGHPRSGPMSHQAHYGGGYSDRMRPDRHAPPPPLRPRSPGSMKESFRHGYSRSRSHSLGRSPPPPPPPASQHPPPPPQRLAPRPKTPPSRTPSPNERH